MNISRLLSAFASASLPTTLESLGFRPSFATALAALDPSLSPARVISDLGARFELADEHGVRLATLAGRLRHDRPTVGDWVATHDAAIHHVLPRRTQLVRRAAGTRGAPQLVAANVDCCFVVTSANRDANPRRLERYLAVIWDSGASPVVVVNKSELLPPEELAIQLAALTSAAPGVPVLAVSAHTGGGLAALAPYLNPGTTVALLGSSGVGKSSLVNRLLGDVRQNVAPIDANDRGRHATTRRQLFALPTGGLVIDTPGMRELGLVDPNGLDETFADLSTLAASCRFRDCRHADEPGCAISAAIADGTLDPSRLSSLHKLERELAARPTNDKARWKSLHKAQRARSKVDPKLRD